MPQAVGQQSVRHSAEALLVSTGQGEELHPQGITALAKWKEGVRRQGNCLPHPQRPWIQSALTATRQDIFSVKLLRKITRILI